MSFESGLIGAAVALTSAFTLHNPQPLPGPKPVLSTTQADAVVAASRSVPAIATTARQWAMYSAGVKSPFA